MSLDDALEIAFLSDTGRVRNHNEDSVAVDPGLGLVVLADGMGGYAAGEVASAVAVTHVFQYTRDGLATLVPGQTDMDSGLRYESLIVHDAVTGANDEVYKAARDNQEYSGMGTTIVAALFYDNRITCVHVGDSRMYLARGGRLKQLTSDHSVVQEFVEHGLYSIDEAKASFSSNLVTRALGVEKSVKTDIHESTVQPGDVYLICSDGLTDMVSEDRIMAELMAGSRLEACAERLVQLANRHGGDDNITLVLVKVKRDFKTQETWQNQLLDLFNPRSKPTEQSG